MPDQFRTIDLLSIQNRTRFHRNLDFSIWVNLKHSPTLDVGSLRAGIAHPFPESDGRVRPGRNVRLRGSLSLPCDAPAAPPFSLHRACAVPALRSHRPRGSTGLRLRYSLRACGVRGRVRTRLTRPSLALRCVICVCQDVNGARPEPAYNANSSNTATGKE
jgi:hypothetical protein